MSAGEGVGGFGSDLERVFAFGGVVGPVDEIGDGAAAGSLGDDELAFFWIVEGGEEGCDAVPSYRQDLG